MGSWDPAMQREKQESDLWSDHNLEQPEVKL